MKPTQEMERLFEDLPEAILNTTVVARRTAFAAPKRKPILPSLAGDREGEAAMLRSDSHKGLIARLRFMDESLAGLPDTDVEAKYPHYFKRLEFEVDIIVKMGFPGYFLIVADFIKWAKDHDIPVGPGRGSGAGSVVAWALTITDLDPLRLGLLFERFLNPERVSMPDFDIDFCETRRGEVIRYVQEKYGRDHVAQIITFGKLKARAVLKDTGRVLQMSYGQVDRLAKLVPNHPTDPWTLDRAINGVSELHAEYEREPEVKRLLDLAMQLEGFPAPLLHPRGRRGDRRPPARSTGPALSRSALGHARHPVRHEACRGCWPREVRLPRPQDVVGAAEGRADAGEARHRGGPVEARLG